MALKHEPLDDRHLCPVSEDPLNDLPRRGSHRQAPPGAYSGPCLVNPPQRMYAVVNGIMHDYLVCHIRDKHIDVVDPDAYGGKRRIRIPSRWMYLDLNAARKAGMADLEYRLEDANKHLRDWQAHIAHIRTLKYELERKL